MTQCVPIGFALMPVERFKKIFFDPCPKDRIPELLNCLSDEDRKAFEAYLKAFADAQDAETREADTDELTTPIEYDPIPCNADVSVFFENEQTAKTWNAVVREAGKVEAIVDNNDNRYTSMEALKDKGVCAFTLEFEHTVGVHDSPESDSEHSQQRNES